MGGKRKLRQLSRLSPSDRIALELHALATRPFVLSTEDDFAGYFNSLGFTINLTDTALDGEIINLCNEILTFLGERLPDSENKNPFYWQISFIRRNETVALLFPEDRLRDIEDVLTPL